MNKDTYYFSHDTNAKDDPKCVLLIEQLGMEGYGIFWVLIETLRDQPNYKYPVANIAALARRYNTSAETMRAVIYDYELFVIEEELTYYSESLNRRMEIYNSLKTKRSESGRLGNAKRWGSSKSDRNATTEQSQSDRNAITEQSQSIAIKGKESKGKERKVKESNSRFTPPSFDEVSDYIAQKGYTSINPQSFIDFYDSNGWLVGKNPMKSWKAALSTWNSRDDGNRASTLQTLQKAQHYDDL